MSERQDAAGLYSWADHEPRIYDDRADAGAVLAERLLYYRGRNPLVLAIPRGGVPVAREVATRLDAELDVIVARKLGAPHQRELAIGAVTSNGTRVLNSPLIRMLAVPDEYLERVTAEQRDEAIARELKFRRGLPALDLTGRTVILVDDGLATGATMRACIDTVKKSRYERLVVAVPVGAPETCSAIARDVDEVVCPRTPDPLFAVGAHYASFEQVSDEEVMSLLREYREERKAGLVVTTSA